MYANAPSPVTLALPPVSPSVRNRSASRSPRRPDGLGRIQSPLLRAAAGRVAAAWRDADGNGAGEEQVTELLALLANTVHRRQTDPAAPVDQRLCTVFGRRLLELLRAEVVRGWMQNGAAHPPMRALLGAIENVREAIEPHTTHDFAARLSGLDGVGLVVDIAHDLRSPLTSILFLAETLQRGQSGPVTDLQRRQLGLIYGAALGLSSVTNDVIELARGGEQLVEKEPEPFSVTHLLESVRDIVWPIAEEKHLDIRLLPPATDHRLGHPIALSRVLLNLTTNALKFTDDGCVDIATKEISRTRVEFSVRDTGEGIDPAVVANLYQPFRRPNGKRRRCFSDTGLGLAMCRKLVEAMSSELKVETRRGWGTRFFFELDLLPYGKR